MLAKVLSFAGIATDARPHAPALRLIPGGPAAKELCMLPVDVDPANIPDAGWLGLKLDGFRTHWVGDRLATREGGLVDCALHCVPGIQRLEEAYGQPMFFDAEYVEEDGFDATMAAFKRGLGNGVLWLFDAVPLDEWRVNRCTQPIEDRVGILKEKLAAARSPHIGLIDLKWCPSQKVVRDQTQAAWAMGYEGTVWKRGGSLYERDKSDDWQRWKELVTMDCLVLDVLGTKKGEFKGLLVKGPFGPLNVSTGFTAADKRTLQCVGHNAVVEVAFNRKAGDSKPRHARFVRVRIDKVKA